jgi:hypothetical protein
MEGVLMLDPSMITGVLGDGKLSSSEISKLVSENSPLPVPAGIVQGVLDQLVSQGKIKKTEENGEVFYHL